MAANGSLKGNLVYEYDANGNRISNSFSTPDGTLVSQSSASFDPLSNLCELTYYGFEGDINSKEIYTYYADDLLIERKSLDRTGKQISRVSYEFEAESNSSIHKVNCSSSVEFDAADNPLNKREYAYNEDGTIQTELVSNFTNETTFSYEREYDGNNNGFAKFRRKTGLIRRSLKDR